MTKIKKVYISGKISGLDIKVAKELFADAEAHLKKLGYQVVNPMKLPHNHAQTWADYMLEDLAAMKDCQAIYMLPNWTMSHGAQIEHLFAKGLDMEVWYGL